ncbi:hypothetical protein EYF80_041983 [Liparis tanakae]|uniref:Uncharacterized protein n=1 Tax=Liparis tanakae TaxID=230148 RepID=A0A4Z2G3T7_9TELE|nr:hypothetical protein EYF80_041983 [Liparis tanakae]
MPSGAPTAAMRRAVGQVRWRRGERLLQMDGGFEESTDRLTFPERSKASQAAGSGSMKPGKRRPGSSSHGEPSGAPR